MKKLVTVILIFAANCTYAQSLNHLGLMPTIDLSGTITRKLDYSLYYFGMANVYNDKINSVQDKSGLFVFYSEQALTFKVTPALSVTGSYVYERQNPFDNSYRNENRFYLQGTYKYSLRKTTVKHRLRFDGRFIQNQLTRDAPFTHRLRYLTGITTPLSKTGNQYFTAYNEFFFNTFKGATAIYGENWAYAAIGFKTGKNSAVEAGPIYIFWVNDNKGTLNNFYYLQLTWVTHVSFVKKQN